HAYYNLGNALIQVKRFEEATEAFKKAVDLDKSLWQAASNLGMLLFGLNHHEEALKYLRHAASAEPQEPEFHHIYGTALIHLEKYSEATEAFKKLHAMQPDIPTVAYVLAHLHGIQNQDTEALEMLTKSINMDSTYKAKAVSDEAFSHLRDNPAFVAIVG
ncbi:MAG TPA: tetratricopeptide repeat protein, partial [Thermodesulfovibrionia bacterium]|nr:tetratricopeptide repeat protein [Thermodesulfovibrionia bacterium]